MLVDLGLIPGDLRNKTVTLNINDGHADSIKKFNKVEVFFNATSVFACITHNY